MTENINIQEKPSFWDKVKKYLKLTGKYIWKFLKWFKNEFITYPLYILAHPIRGFDEFKRDKKGKTSVAVVFMLFAVLLNIMSYQFTGFVISQESVTKLKVFAEFAYIFGPVLLLTVSNWSITTLFDGKGKMREIFTMLGYCLFPFVWANFIGLFVSNIVSQQEQAMYTLIIALGVFLMCYMGFFGFVSINEYGVLKCVLTLLFTVIAALVICFIGILFFDLIQKMGGFIYTIYREIALRYL